MSLGEWPAPREAPSTVITEEEFRALYPDESGHVEFKRGLSGRKVQEAIVSFSNAAGGEVLIGVDDDGNTSPFPLSEDVRLRIHQLCGEASSIGRYETAELLVGDAPVTIIRVAAASGGVAQTADGRALVRRGKSNVVLRGDELVRLASARSLRRFETTSTAVTVDDVDTEAFSRIAAANAWGTAGMDPAELLSASPLVCGDGRHLTLAGALLLTTHPDRIVGKAVVEVFRYPTATTTDYDRRALIQGPVDEQIEAATRWLADELGYEIAFVGARRVELPRIPLVVLRETIANAVGHRDYQLGQTSIRVEVRPTEVRVTSPGGLPEPITPDNMRELQASRNPDLMRALRALGLAEDAGRGVDLIQDTMRAEFLGEPAFLASDSQLEVVLPLRGVLSPTERAALQQLELRQEITRQDRSLVLQLLRGETLTNSSVRDRLGVDSVAARRMLRSLVELGLAQRHGRKSGTEYRPSETLRGALGLGGPASDPAAALMAEVERHGRIQNADVRRVLGIDRVEALRLLETLVSDGHLARHGRARGTYYTRP